MRNFMVFALLLALQPAFAQSVTVMTYNIRLDTEQDGVNQWGKRTEKVIQLIKKYDPDLLGVQEAMHNQMLDLAKSLPGYAYVGVARDDGKEKGEYSAIFYKKEKFDVLSQNTFWLSETPTVPGSKSWDAAITRVASYALLRDKKSGKSFAYFNTHFDHIGKEARKNSARLIKGFIAGFQSGVRFGQNNKEVPVLVSGDFNSEPTDEPYKTMVDGAEVKLADSRPAKDMTGTYCGFEVGKIECRTIDYIFYSPHWKAKSYKVIQDNDGKYYPSDHLPVLSRFSLIK